MKYQKFRDIICVVFGHSRLVTNCFGYKSCARCSQQLGDSLAGVGLPVGKNGYFQIGQTCQCAECKASFDSLRWIDRFLCPKAEFPTDEFVSARKKEKEEAFVAMRKKTCATA